MTKSPNSARLGYRPAADARCIARAKGSGERCQRMAIKGGTVCIMHGGAAPQTRAKALERLQAMVPKAISSIEKLIETADSDGVRLAASRDVLDRTGYKPADVVEQINRKGAPEWDLTRLDAEELATLERLRAKCEGAE